MPYDWSWLFGNQQPPGQNTQFGAHLDPASAASMNAGTMGGGINGIGVPAFMQGMVGGGGGGAGPSGIPYQPTPAMTGANGATGASGVGNGLMGSGMLGPLSAAAAMLQASGPSRMPTNFGQIMGQGLGGMMQGSMVDQQMQQQQQSQQNMARIAQILAGQQGGQGQGQNGQGVGAPPVMMPPPGQQGMGGGINGIGVPSFMQGMAGGGGARPPGIPAPPTTPIPGNPSVNMTGAGPNPNGAFYGYMPGPGMPSSLGAIAPRPAMGQQSGQQAQMSPMTAMFMGRRGMGMLS